MVSGTGCRQGQLILKKQKLLLDRPYEWGERKKTEGIPSSKKTLAYFADLYIEHLQKSVNAGKQVGTFTGYIKVAEKYIKPIIGHVKIGSVGADTKKVYEAKRDEVWRGNISKSSVNTHNVVTAWYSSRSSRTSFH